METQKTKKCPKCGEEILASAKRCKYCQADIRNWFMRHKIITGILMLILIGIIGSLGSGDKKETKQSEKKADVQEVVKTEDTEGEKPQEEKAEEEKIYKIKEPVPVGNFIVAVLAIDESKTLSDGLIQREADGIYRMVGIMFTNKDKEAHSVDSTMFKLVDDKGRKFVSSSEGNTIMSMSSNGKQDLFLKQVNPSVTASGVAVFDIPKDAQGLKLEVSGGIFSSEKKLIELQ